MAVVTTTAAVATASRGRWSAPRRRNLRLLRRRHRRIVLDMHCLDLEDQCREHVIAIGSVSGRCAMDA
jgi:hypothetical protein